MGTNKMIENKVRMNNMPKPKLTIVTEDEEGEWYVHYWTRKLDW